jgi:putative peptidoglycan lipid II flippase
VGAVLLAVTGALAGLVVVLCFVVPPEALGLEDARAADGSVVATSAQRGAALLHLTKIVFPYVVPICAAAILTGAQNALGIFGWPALAPALLNVLWVGALFGVMALGVEDPMTIATVLSVAVLAAGFVQVAPSLVQLARRDCLPRPAWPAPGDAARGVFAATLPTMLGMSMTQFSMLVDQVFAEWFCGPGMTTHLYLANRLLLFPHALTSLALAQAVFPRFARLATREELVGLDAEVARALHWTFLVTVPASLGLILVSPQLIGVFFVHGQFGEHDAYWTVRTTATLVAGLPFIGMAQLHARALYALGDMRTPAIVAGLLLVLGIGLSFLLVLGLGLGVAGLTIATSLGAIVNAILLRRRFLRLCGAAATARGAAVPVARILAAVAAMCAVVLGLESWLQVPASGGRTARALLGVVLPVVLGVATFGAVPPGARRQGAARPQAGLHSIRTKSMYSALAFLIRSTAPTRSNVRTSSVAVFSITTSPFSLLLMPISAVMTSRSPSMR